MNSGEIEKLLINGDFAYKQYERLSWENQDKTGTNSLIIEDIVRNIVSKKAGEEINIFDMGFGVGSFLKKASDRLSRHFKSIRIRGCEPCVKHYEYFKNLNFRPAANVKIETENSAFENIEINEKYDWLTAIYVFPHIHFEKMEATAQKISGALRDDGRLALVVANENYIRNKIKANSDLLIDKKSIEYNGKLYDEYLHYSELPDIGAIIDYNRDERLYADIFSAAGLELSAKIEINENGFISTIFEFLKK